jgi:hypothetical protein
LDCTGSGSALESFARDSKQLVKDIAAADASVTNAIKYCRAFRLRAFRSPLAHRAIRAQVWGPLQAAIAGSQPLPFEPSAAPLNSMTPRLQQLQVPALSCAPAAADNDVAAAAGDDFDGAIQGWHALHHAALFVHRKLRSDLCHLHTSS